MSFHDKSKLRTSKLQLTFFGLEKSLPDTLKSQISLNFDVPDNSELIHKETLPTIVDDCACR